MRNVNSSLPIHDGSKFTWKDGHGCIEASDLGRGYTGRVWQDACDVGFIVRSHKTGAEKLFVYAGGLSSSGDVSDVYGFRYDSDDGIHITVFND